MYYISSMITKVKLSYMQLLDLYLFEKYVASFCIVYLFVNKYYEVSIMVEA